MFNVVDIPICKLVPALVSTLGINTGPSCVGQNVIIKTATNPGFDGIAELFESIVSRVARVRIARIARNCDYELVVTVNSTLCYSQNCLNLTDLEWTIGVDLNFMKFCNCSKNKVNNVKKHSQIRLDGKKSVDLG